MTPDEWLLAHYDQQAKRAVPANSVSHVRPIFDILNDHAEDECTPSPNARLSVECRRWSTPAQWPQPRACNNIAAFDARDSSEYRQLIRADVAANYERLIQAS